MPVPSPTDTSGEAQLTRTLATWHDIFEDDEDAAVFGAQTLRDNGLLRIQSGQVSLQCCVKIRKEALLLRQRENPRLGSEY